MGALSASSLTDSLRSVVRLRRAVSAHSKAVIRLSTESGDNAGKNMMMQHASKRFLEPL
uniref:Alpha-hemolysin n=1 Tax=Burkholderia cenocepacia TaxID=95486 RepID=B8R6A9_9BURK|nr:alpha-hemolysin [Burkholderia cenocepacia]